MPFRRQTVIGLLLIGAISLALILFLVPNQSRGSTQGSTYGRSPDGYGAWYAYMEKQGTPLHRWQKPLGDFTKFARKGDRPKTLIVITPPPDQFVSNWFKEPLKTTPDWIDKGHNLVLVGVPGDATMAPFSTTQSTIAGPVQIDTSRRNLKIKMGISLGDSYGAIAWIEAKGKGRIISLIPSYLAANAYQNSMGNFEFLEGILDADKTELWVDEYSHGYRDPDVVKKEGHDNVFAYLGQTPLLIFLIQAAVTVLIGLWGQRRRWGVVHSIEPPEPNNSQAYIEALASVLQRASSDRFVAEQLVKADRQSLQQFLGLGLGTVADAELVQSWTQRTGKSGDLLRPFLKADQSQDADMLRSNLKTGLQQLQAVRTAIQDLNQ
jgi:Domain of unknown function (DUF4350)